MKKKPQILILSLSGIVTYSHIWLTDWSEQASKDEIINDGLQNKDHRLYYLVGYGALGAAQGRGNETSRTFQKCVMIFFVMILCFCSRYLPRCHHVFCHWEHECRRPPAFRHAFPSSASTHGLFRHNPGGACAEFIYKRCRHRGRTRSA